MATMSIRLSDSDKKKADLLFKEMGVTINSAINMFIKQCIRNQGLPFIPTVNVQNSTPSKELLEALQEGEDILNGKIQKKGYHNVRRMVEDILSED